jgi:hypothetical protein
VSDGVLVMVCQCLRVCVVCVKEAINAEGCTFMAAFLSTIICRL